ncbi:DNA-directed RNA polymerase subunit B [Candidatus Woesearchaeota archaeon]|nr:DNA-directed RNA polymerase subunit B [Candidatus Woesearchaeota archaeon]
MITEVYLNYKYIGDTNTPEEFAENIISERRKGNISKETNVCYEKETNRILIDSSKGRARRPLIIVKDGKSLITDNHVKQLEKGELNWNDLIEQGLIEYLDALEEENTLIAIRDEELTPEYTHLEIAPIAMLGLCASLVPYSNFGPGMRNLMGAKNQKHALGFYAANYPLRIDTDVNLLHYPQIPIVKSITHDLYHDEKHPAGQNLVVAVMSYGGYNMEDAIIINKGSVDRGLARSTYFYPAVAEELRYAGGLVDEVSIPNKEVKGYRSEQDYRLLEDDGIISPEAHVKEGDVVIGRTSPPRFLSSMDEYNLTSNTRRESSISIKHGEKGTVDFILLTENGEGNKLIQVRIRDQRIPEIGDKFITRGGQKGVIGIIKPQADMPYSLSGIIPDLIFSPYGIPSRMTISHLIELIGGKVGAMAGRQVDGTTFDSEDEKDLRKLLAKMGLRDNGMETMYDGQTGEMIPARIYVGNLYYQKIKLMVANRIQSRARGPVQLLTRQPTEGRDKEGGLRFGEMEKDCLIAHGASLLLKERFDADKTIVPLCENCGMIAIHDQYKNKSYCTVCGDNVEITNIEISYAFKLLLDELKSIGFYPKLQLRNKY